MGLISVRGLDHPLTGNAFLSEKVCKKITNIKISHHILVKTTNLIHDIELQRDSFLRLQDEGKVAKAGFVSFGDMENSEQVQKWTTSKVQFHL